MKTKSRANLQRGAARTWPQPPAAVAPPQMQHEPAVPLPPQKLSSPGLEQEMNPPPRWQAASYRPAHKLEGKVALITGGDSGIGRAVAVLFAREGAEIAIGFLAEERKDAVATQEAVEAVGKRCLLLPGDLTRATACRQAVEKTVATYGRLDLLVSNAARQVRSPRVEELPDEEFDRTFKTNIYACFWLVKAALSHLPAGGAIIVTSSETGIMGSIQLPHYSATKGAINAFVKALAMQLIPRGIRINAIAPGPVWTPLNPADPGLPKEKVARFGGQTPLGRPAQPEELAPAYVFLASDADSSYITGIVLQVMGGETTGG